MKLPQLLKEPSLGNIHPQSIVGGVGRTLAQNIEAEVKKLGQNSRGVKTRKNSNGKDYYAFIRSTKCPAVIVEGVFVDNAMDVQIADTLAEQKAFGVAYAKGILKTLGITEKAPVASTETKKLYCVQVEANSIRANAERLVKELEAKGYKPFIVEKEVVS